MIFESEVNELPDGTFILLDEKPFLLLRNLLFAWTVFGYEEGILLPSISKVKVLTPKSIVNTFRAGYAGIN